MIGVILAAGVGSRLRPITSRKPKCLVRVCGKSLLDYQLEAYIKAGVDKVVVVVGYEAQAVREHCKHIKGVELVLVENADYELTNNMYSLYLARDHIRDHAFILNNADLAIQSDILKRINESEDENVVAVDRGVYMAESMKITVSPRNLITDISKTIPEGVAYGCSIDFYKFSQRASQIFLDEVTRIVEKENNRKDWTEVALQRLFREARLPFAPLDVSGLKWVEIDNYEDLAQADRVFACADQWVDSIGHYFFDLDGTIYTGNKSIQGSTEAVLRLRALGKRVSFISNNSSKSKAAYASRLTQLGVPTTASDIVLSTDGLIAYLKDAAVRGVYVLGTRSLKDTLRDSGFEVESATPEFVVIGYDTELTYEKLVAACTFINKGVDILATHCDVFCPTEVGPVPDIGAILEMIYLTTGMRAKKVFGKPDASMLISVLEKNGLLRERVAIVGDRLHTDMAMARNLGVRGILVLTGETTRERLEEEAQWPDLVLGGVRELPVLLGHQARNI